MPHLYRPRREAGTPPGPQPTTIYTRNYLEEVPALRIPINDLLVESCKASLRVLYTWIDANSDSTSRISIIVLQLNDRDEFVERWSCYDRSL
ncbi:TPA: hypothetical protein DCE37_23735, partial [Candidatus Latescibacteria bacterium]|nr:hypothetical protein [Candidatus Latescibacterota bacterium]